MSGATGVSGTLEPPGMRWFTATTRPEPVIALVGTTQLHRDIAKIMHQHKREYPADVVFNLRELDTEDQIRRKKERRHYEGYIPAGILKADWCRKHQEDVFGCVLTLVNIDAAATREAFESFVENIVEKLKGHLRWRLTKILVVVTTGAERLPFYDKPENCQTAVRKRCDLETQKNVALLHATKGLSEGVKRVLQVAQDLALVYYREEARRVKKLKESAHRFLQPRHRFKVAYFFEIQRQTDLALKYYGQCYELIRNLSADAFSATEIKAAAEVVMFRTCLIRLLYDDVCKVGAAVRMFREHMSWYRTCGEQSLRQQSRTSQGRSSDMVSPSSRPARIPSNPMSPSVTSGGDLSSVHSGSGGAAERFGGSMYSGPAGSSVTEAQVLSAASPAEVLLHHVAVARQHERFGWLLQRAHITSSSITNDGGEYANPGYHYHCSATAVEGRKRQARSMAASSPPTAAVELPEPAFLGQPQGPEEAFVRQLLIHEREVNYEEEIVTLCMNARTAYAKRCCKRMNLCLSLLIAKCYAEQHRWDEVKQQLADASQYFSIYSWPALSDAVLQLLMQCGLQTSNLGAYLQAALQYVAGTGRDRAALFYDIATWLKGEESTTPELLNAFKVPPEESPLQQLPPQHPLLSVNVKFSHPCISAHEEAHLKVRLSTKAAFPVPVSAISVNFQDAGLDFSHVLEGETRVVTATAPLVVDLPVLVRDACIVKVKAVTVDVIGIRLCRSFGEQPDLLTRLSSDAAQQPSTYPYSEEVTFPMRSCPTPPFLDRPAMRVFKPEPVLTLRLIHQPPALLNEVYPVQVAVSTGSEAVKSGSIVLPGGQDVHVVRACVGGEEVQVKQIRDTSSEVFEGKVSVSAELPLPNAIPENTELTVTVYLRFATCGSHPMPVIVRYATNRSAEMQVQAPMELPVVIPFHLRTIATDTINWVSGGLETVLCNPHRCAGFIQTCNTHPGGAKGHDGASTTADNFLHAAEMSRLGVSSRMTPTHYSVHTTKVPHMESAMRLEQPVALTVTAICNVSSFDIEVSSFKVKPSCNMEMTKEPADESVLLGDGEEVGYTWSVRPLSDAGLSAGAVVYARRKGSQDPPIPFSLPLPTIPVERASVIASFHVPASGVIGEVLTLTLLLRNTCDDAVKEVHCDAHDFDKEMEKRFLWSGRSSFVVSILPRNSASIQYHLIPVYPGYVTLPSMAVRVEGHATLVVKPSEAASIFIGPCSSSFRSPRNS